MSIDWPQVSILPVGALTQLQNGFPFDSADFKEQGSVALVRIRDICSDDFSVFIDGQIPERVMLRNGDLVIGMDGDFNLVRWSRGPAALNQRLCRLRARPGCDLRFVEYSLPSHLRLINDTKHATTVKHLTSNEVLKIRIAAPPLAEQRRIADFLDDQVTRIDQAIHLRQTMIDRMAERLRSETQSLVLGRLDQVACRSAEGPLLPAPSGWQVRRNKTFMREVVDLSATGTEEMLTVSHITGVTPRSEKNVYMFEAATNEGYKRVQSGDLVINTMWAWMGALGVAATSGIVSPAYGVYRFVGDGLNPRYFDALFRSPAYVTEMTRYSRGVWSSRLRLYPDSFLALVSPIPPIAVQNEIASHVDVARLDVATSTDALERSLVLLEERKRSLITAAVTGEFDVSSASSRAVGVASSGV